MPVNTIPTLTNALDNAFTQTWFDMRGQAMDNILNATVVWALLKSKGVFKPQTGSKKIERTVKYATGFTPQAVGKGSTLPSGEKETRTAAFWNFQRTLATHIQRSLFDDVENAGPYRIVDYLTERTTEATDALKQMLEYEPFRPTDTTETGTHMQGFCDIVPPPASRASGTYGGITRCDTYTTNTAKGITTSDYPDFATATAVNPWWSPRYKQFTLPIDVNLVTDMQNFYNVITDNIEPPDVCLMSQSLYELYCTFGLDATMFVNNQKMLDLGFTTVKWMGMDLTWCTQMGAGTTMYDDSATTCGYSGLTNAMLFLNTKYIEAVYNPLMWFQMSEWKPWPTQAERIAHIFCRMTMVSDQLRRHGLMYQS